MAVSTNDIKILREKTGAGMLDCKKALEQNDNNIDKAVDYLREKGLSKALSKQSRVAADGLAAFVSKGNLGFLYEVNSETDFVAQNVTFKELVKEIGNDLLEANVSDVEEALKFESNNLTIEQKLFNLTAKLGEKLTLRKLVKVEKQDPQSFASYSHNGGKIVSVVVTDTDNKDVNNDMAMQVAASKPQFLKRDDVDSQTVEHEKKVLTQQALNEGKPKEIVDKMIIGRLNKFFQDICLVDQAYIKDPNLKVSQFLKQNNANVLKFFSIVVGEGIEKIGCDFATEVEQQLKSVK